MPGISVTALLDSHPLVATQLPSWYPLHASHSLKSVSIPVPSEFLLYLQEDGVFLPDDSAAVPHLDHLDAALLAEGDYRRDDWEQRQIRATATALQTQLPPTPSGPLHAGRDGLLSGSPQSSGLPHPNVASNTQTSGRQNAEEESASARGLGADGQDPGESDSDGDSSSGSGAPGQVRDWTVRFPQLRSAVDAAIASLGGQVVPKLNWSCPSDALWVSATGSLACRNAEQVMLLLKSSDRTAHDVTLLVAAAEAAAQAEGSGEVGAEPSGGRAAHSDAAPPGGGAAAAPPRETVDMDRDSGSGAATTKADEKPIISRQQQQQQPGNLHSTSSPTLPFDGCGRLGLIGSSDQAAAAAIVSGLAAATPPCPERLAGKDSATSGQSDRRPEGGGEAAGPGPGSGAGGGAGWALRSSGHPCSSLRPVLVLKKWYNLRPEREFRCFVRCGQLVGASQRDVSQAFPALTAEVVEDVRRRLWRFWAEKMRGSLALRDFAYDVYVPSDSPSTVRLVDINPLTDTTSPLLFDWAELGFGPAAVPPADHLLRQLLPEGGSRGEDGQRRGSVGRGGEGERGLVAEDPNASAAAAMDESWMEEGSLLAALPVPSRAEELQVRIVQTSGNTGGQPAGGGDTAAAGAEGFGLGSLVGPMLLGSRAALAMPYDMLGIADSVDKMIEFMRQQGQQRGPRGARQGGSDSSESESDDEAEGDSQEQQEGDDEGPGICAPAAGLGVSRWPAAGADCPEGAEAGVGGDVFTAGDGLDGLRQDEDEEAAGTVAEMMAIMGAGQQLTDLPPGAAEL